jgi:hypothetical protein
MEFAMAATATVFLSPAMHRYERSNQYEANYWLVEAPLRKWMAALTCTRSFATARQVSLSGPTGRTPGAIRELERLRATF